MKLTKINKSKRDIKYKYDSKEDFFVFDTETQGLEPRPRKFIFGVVYGYRYVKVIKSVRDFKKEFRHERYYNKTIFAHNCEYDLLSIYGNIFKYLDNKALFNGSNFISATLNKKRKVKFADSLNILKLSVDKIGKSLGYPKGKLRQEYKDAKVKQVTKEDINYCIQDCKIIYKALRQFFNEIGKVKLTIASSAMYYFRSNFLESDIYYNRELSNKFFNSYYGGRTEAFKIGNVSGIGYDINSLYPYIMKNIKFPDPQYLVHEQKVNKDFFIKQILPFYEGCCKVKVNHKNNYFGYLPYRSDKLLFPVGAFSSWVNFNELRFAINNSFVELSIIDEIIYSTQTIETPFSDYVNQLYTSRLKTDFEFEKIYLKFLMNSLYGKFAEKIKEQTIYFEIFEDAYKFIKIQEKPENFEIKLFNKVRTDCFVIETLEESLQPKHSIPVFASYITSAARIELLKNLIEFKEFIPLYVDTDSIYFEKEPIGLDIGINLGQWKKEDKEIRYIRGLKSYDYFKPSTGEYIEKIKGISKNAIKLEPNRYKITKYYKTKGSLRSQVESGTKLEIIKELSNEYDKREVLKDRNTKPIVINEL